jgi:hypothetical protein
LKVFGQKSFIKEVLDFPSSLTADEMSLLGCINSMEDISKKWLE